MPPRLRIGKHSISSKTLGVSVELEHCTKCGRDAPYPSAVEATPCEREAAAPASADELERVEKEIERLEFKGMTEVMTAADERALLADIKELKARRDELAAQLDETDDADADADTEAH